MSRLGKMPISLPKGVEVKEEHGKVILRGPKGQLEMQLPVGLTFSVKEQKLLLFCDQSKIENDGFYGLYWALLNNAVIGVSTGFEVKLTMIGVGYRAAVQGSKLDLQLGFSHPTWLIIPKGLQVDVDKGTSISVKGSDKRLVGEFAAKIREVKPPEPYKGKGVRYEGEYVRKKEGKAAKGKA
ncbi:MAG: 50S ribosomal protein L6 [Chlamydiae bacterium RIFCSPHIGHO2_12_FULL_44_59]|nr:MAG: 50S ribosomal protein L6 [Chlamydiae bacterium RIFCSPHIGHO2_01_FULL_44_39]OGN58589.1 MAG: 50S ribosomal protein L6 [Chlamydiae bacterium RIFCSPHIGHO2_02_FULL_45_9]OGN60539.1 MAG: 50S ribosomal protein L6 [Chlamydiae bacterium RIFCSPHIGHO2_12_FULL_44_59]OGN65994.1 MAG: 50S ribosomal protein L6 [Chlamydiae bacterium RIFCSPLOWO2_01_FULL_44_52]OGN68809.1 MAG: 50S ribosomal protein L6 [Chlamydiae bacterium RIFCSPLOWO2_02_FULL_45_22]OGN70449.1 MAG: 50S ribosomal protein L6 [Chlamydiae bacter